MRDADIKDIAGGCLCGAVRWQLRSAPTDADFFHCALCRHVTGAPVPVFAPVRNCPATG